MDETHALGGVKTAAFVGDTLYVEGEIDGAARFGVISIDAEGVARLHEAGGELLGPANVVELWGGAHARLRRGEGGEVSIDVVDTTVASAPALAWSVPVAGVVEPAEVFAAVEGRLFFCREPAGGGEREMVRVDLSDPAAPGEPVATETWACNTYEEKTHAAAGGAWIAWSHPTGNFVQDTFLYTLGTDEIVNLVNYGYNQYGVHQYGDVLTAATSARRAVFDAVNKSLFLVANPEGNPYDVNDPPFTWASLTVGESRSLLGVADTTVYLATDAGVRAYDLTDILAPELLAFEAQVGPAEGALRTVATSERFLAVVDEAGTLFLVPRATGGSVGPIVVHSADYVVAQEGCGD